MQASDAKFSGTVDNKGSARVWSCGGRLLDLSRPLIMGIVNATPDSFSDGGAHNDVERAVAWGRKLAADGADILDVGGESTRPGAEEVSVDEEIARVVPVIRALAAEGFVLSVDTSKPEVMQAALEAGVCILNDVRAFEAPGSLEVAAASTAGLVIMHMRGTPRTMQNDPSYADVTDEIERYLTSRQQALEALGVNAQRICWDAGFGFGKTVEHNFSILKHTERFAARPGAYLVGLSRKSFIGAATGVQVPCERVAGSVAAALLAIERGANVVRVHDVLEMRQAIDVYEATRRAP